MMVISKTNTGATVVLKTPFNLGYHNAHKPLVLVYNEPELGTSPFNWPDGVLLTREAYIRFMRLATRFEVQTHSWTSIEPDVAALGPWSVLVLSDVVDLYEAHSNQL
jgi:hypothetical protein